LRPEDSGIEELAPKKDAHVAAKLREAGAIIIGKTSMHELAAFIMLTPGGKHERREWQSATADLGGFLTHL
jgi:hypothetical protein